MNDLEEELLAICNYYRKQAECAKKKHPNGKIVKYEKVADDLYYAHIKCPDCNMYIARKVTDDELKNSDIELYSC